MTNSGEPTCSTRDVVAAIRLAYRSARPGRYYGAEKLGVEELLGHLVAAGVVPVAAARDPRAMPIQILVELPSGRGISSGVIWRLQHRFKTLGDLAGLSFAELVVEADVGAIPAQKIEVALASFSVLLRDGDPALLRRPPAPEVEEPGPAPDPEQALATCGRALLLLARKVMLDGASLAAIAAQVALHPGNARKQLRMYSRARYGRTAATEVTRIAAPILVTGPTEAKRRKVRRANPAASAPETGNVVPIVFGTGKAIPK